jgi:negative regulator of sigma E activity
MNTMQLGMLACVALAAIAAFAVYRGRQQARDMPRTPANRERMSQATLKTEGGRGLKLLVMRNIGGW